MRLYDGMSGDRAARTDRHVCRYSRRGFFARRQARSPPPAATAGSGFGTTRRGAVVRDIKAHRQRVRALGSQSTARNWPRAETIGSCGSGIPKRATELLAIPSRPGKIHALVYLAPDKLVTGASDNTIRIWDLKSGKEESRLLGHTGSVSSLDYRAETGILISAGFDTSVRLWTPLSTDGKVVEENRNRTHAVIRPKSRQIRPCRSAPRSQGG